MLLLQDPTKHFNYQFKTLIFPAVNIKPLGPFLLLYGLFTFTFVHTQSLQQLARVYYIERTGACHSSAYHQAEILLLLQQSYALLSPMRPNPGYCSCGLPKVKYIHLPILHGIAILPCKESNISMYCFANVYNLSKWLLGKKTGIFMFI